MKSVGADIRIVNAPKEKVAALVRNFIESESLDTVKDVEVSDKLTNIRTSKTIDSYFKFWWKGIPQVIDWKIIELKNEKTKIEIRFGNNNRYKIWFWGVLTALTVLFSIFYEIYYYKFIDIDHFG